LHPKASHNLSQQLIQGKDADFSSNGDVKSKRLGALVEEERLF
jgi:hypothetical protein